MGHYLVTGGSGFFGGLLQASLLEQGHTCVNIDLEPDLTRHSNLVSVQGDIRDVGLLEKVFAQHRFDAVFHCAAILAHAIKDMQSLWTSNVDGTRNVAAICRKYQVQKLIFISSNCLWAKNFYRPVLEEDEPDPVEIYGESKWKGEQILYEFQNDIDITIFRCPTIIDEGRLGLLSILFDFIDEGRKVWVVGGGDNRYQFIYAGDLITACTNALQSKGSHVFNIGSDDVKSFREVYQAVIDRAGTGARVASLPRKPTLLAMQLAHKLKMSPLGPYQYKMIAEDFVFDTAKIKEILKWHPTLTNEEMLYRSYRYYHDNRDEIAGRTQVSAHRQKAKMGIIRLLKWVS
jgi:nucleoside-diphosphate-sugar epimerase